MLNVALRYKINMGKMKLFFDGGLVIWFYTLLGNLAKRRTVLLRFNNTNCLKKKQSELKAPNRAFLAELGLKYSRFSLETRYRLGAESR